MTRTEPVPLRRRRWLLPAVALSAIGVIVGSQSTMALLVFLFDGVPAFVVLAAALLGGLWIVAAVGCGDWALRWQLLLGAALGTGALSLLVLLFGLLGLLHAVLWYALLILAALVGLVRLSSLLRRRADPAARNRSHRLGIRSESAGRWLWLVVCPFAALGVLVASVPPGLLWMEEGSGYDVLEYHLQMPREYLEAGRITYAPHNVYASFPSNVEMLYLLCMVFKGGAVEGAAMAKMLNLGFAVLVVAAGWLVGRERSPVAGVVTGVVTGSVGWLTYLSGVAYVENGMLFFGLTAMAVLVRIVNQPSGSVTLRPIVVCGLLAGLASGCKYTAVAMIAVPLVVVVLGLPFRSLRQRIGGAAAYGLAVLFAFSPWLLKSTAMTGNPVFPLAGNLFTSDPPGWGPEQADHFAASHALRPEDGNLSSRLALLWRHVPADPLQRVGPLLFVLAVSGLLIGPRGRLEALCWLALGIAVLIWLFATHLYSRFAVPFLIPLVVLASGSAGGAARGPLRAVLPSVVLVGSLFNAALAARLYAQHLYVDGTKLPLEGVPEVFMQGKLRGYEWLGAVNTELPADAKLLLIGEARAFYVQREVDVCVVFNRNPFVEVIRAARTDADVVRWLQGQGYTHVLVNWREIQRLRRSRYGFAAEITRDLFARLTAAGLAHVKTITDSFNESPYADLFRVR